jgi:hypothetical protein
MPSSLELHVAGATIRHHSPFSEINVPVIYELSDDIVIKWVRPLYFGLDREGVGAFLEQHLNEVDAKLISALLTQFNWRCRITGAYLIALRELSQFDDWIGKLLLRSDVCYAGKGYCLALATLNTSVGVEYLKKYLAYYLQYPELKFDQAPAMAALMHLDRRNSTSHHVEHLSAWHKCFQENGDRTLDHAVNFFDEKIAHLNVLRTTFYTAR